MIEVTTARYLASLVPVMLTVPLLLILLPQWRYPPRTMARIGLAVEGGAVLFAALCWSLLGPTALCTWLVGLVPTLSCALLFVHCCTLRDGRLPFLLATIFLNSAVSDALTGVAADRDSLAWCAVKVCLTVGQAALLLCLCRRPLLEMLESGQVRWGWMTAIPCSLWACLMGFSILPSVEGRQADRALPTAVLCAAVGLVYVALYRLQKATRQCTEHQQYGELLQREVAAMAWQIQQQEREEERARVLRHDIRHYRSLFRGALSQGDVELAMELLDRLDQAAAPPADREHRTGDTAMDIVLSQIAGEAARAGVGFEARLLLPETLRVDRTELAVVVLNALENAVQAAAREPEGSPRWVSVESQDAKGRLLLKITNACSEQVRLDRRTGLPGTDRPGHGFGTLSIATFARRNGCLVDCKAAEGVFCLRLLI